MGVAREGDMEKRGVSGSMADAIASITQIEQPGARDASIAERDSERQRAARRGRLGAALGALCCVVAGCAEDAVSSGASALGAEVVRIPAGESVVVDALGRETRDAVYVSAGESDDGYLAGARAGLRAVSGAEATPTDLALAAASASPTARLSVAVELEEIPFDFARLRRDVGAEEDRRREVASAQLPLVAEIERLGGRVRGALWMTNVLFAEIPAAAVRAVAEWRGVRSVQLESRVLPENGFTGTQIRNALRSQSFIDANYQGALGNWGGLGRIRIAAIEGRIDSDGRRNYIPRTHYGYRDSSAAVTRVIGVWDASAAGVTATSEDNGSTHGTKVTWVALGDLEDGQDPGIGSSVERRKRSGVAPEALLLYYTITDCAGFAQALQAAIGEFADVVNFSAGLDGTSGCSRSADCGGINGLLRFAADNGVMVVKSAGNGGHAGGCTLTYPAQRPEVISVAAVNTESPGPAYDDSELTSDSSGGPVQIGMYGGGLANSSSVGLGAPGGIYYYFTNAPNGYSEFVSDGGTSFAAPAVSGSIGLLRNALGVLWTPSEDPFNARMLATNTLLLGDAWDGSGPGIANDRTAGLSNTSGFGRAKTYFPSSSNLTAPWGWARGSVAMQPNSLLILTPFQGSLPPGVSQFKLALTWFPTDLSSVSDIVVDVWNVCSYPSPTLLAQDWSYDYRKRVMLRAPTFALPGACLEVRIRGFSMRQTGQTVYYAAYYHSGNPDNH